MSETAALANLEDLYPLSPMQQGMLFHSIYAPGSGVYFEQSVFTLTGDFDPAVFERAWQAVVDRHAILRTAFLWEDLENPVQAVQRHVDLPIERHDWRGQPDRDRRLDSFLVADRRQGFVLSRAPLMRIALIRYGDQEYKFILSRHHMVLDRWSRALVLQDFVAIYDALSAGQQPRLPVARPYSDYIAWLGRQDAAAAEHFWKTALSGVTEPTPFVVDAKPPRHVEPGAEYGDQRTRLSQADTERIQAFARQHRLTLNTIVQAAWALLLARYSGTSDVLFGVSTAGRPGDLPGVEAIVGLLINTLPLRVPVPWSAPLLSWLRRVQESQTALQQYQYSSLLDIHGWSEIPRSQPLFDSILIFENLPVGATKTANGGLQMRSDRGYGSVTNYPITVLVTPGAQLHVQIVFDRSRFEQGSVGRMLEHFVHLLHGMVADAHQPVTSVSLLTAQERQRLLVEWNETAAEYDSDSSVAALFEAQVRTTPDVVAVVADGAEQGWTYADLNRRANQLARHLQGRGVGPEVRIGVLLERSADLILALLGILKAGGAYVPLDPGHPSERLRFAVQDAGIELVLTQQRLARSPAIEGITTICLDSDSGQIDRQPGSDIESAVDGHNLAYVIYTSGSTGTPKGVQIEHRALTNLLCSMRQEPGLAKDDVLLSVTTLSFDIAALELYLPLICGARLVIASQEIASDGDRLQRRLAETGATVMQGTPATWRMLIESGWIGTAGLRALCGGEQLSRELAGQLLSRVGELWNLYGPTETTIWSAACRVEAKPSRVPIGRGIANTQLYVLDSHLEPVPVGLVGELYIAGDGLARGYWNHPELTAEKFLPNPFASRAGERLYRTGDRARFQPDGSIEWLGRVDHQVKVRGFRIELGEIESAIRTHPGVSETVVAVREDVPGDPRLVAYLVRSEAGSGESLLPALRGILASRLPLYMMPSIFVVLDAWPLTGSGKINRQALPVPDATRPELGSDYVEPLTEAEVVLATIWADVLKLAKIGRHDNFFQLGGHSLRAVQVISRVREQFAIEVPLRWLFEHPTVAQLAAAMAALETTATTSATAIKADEDCSVVRRRPVSFAQQRLWFLSRLEPESAAYNMPRPLRLEGALDVAALRQA
ncbi:MAG: amino acid adenylation domain-containing protein, partial [Vicinamibacterales bacterium]